MHKILKSAVAMALAFVMVGTAAGNVTTVFAAEVNTDLLLAESLMSTLTNNSFRVLIEGAITTDVAFDFAGLESHGASTESRGAAEIAVQDGNIYLAVMADMDHYWAYGLGTPEYDIAVVDGGIYINYLGEWVLLGFIDDILEFTGLNAGDFDQDWNGIWAEVLDELTVTGSNASSISSYSIVAREGEYYHRIYGRVSPQHNYTHYNSAEYKALESFMYGFLGGYMYLWQDDSFDSEKDGDITSDMAFTYYINARTGNLEMIMVSFECVNLETLDFMDSALESRYSVNAVYEFTDFNKDLNVPEITR